MEHHGNCKCLKLLQMIALNTNLCVFKANQNMLPYKVQKRYRSVNQVHDYNTRSTATTNLFKPNAKKSLKYMCTSMKRSCFISFTSKRNKDCIQHFPASNIN